MISTTPSQIHAKPGYYLSEWCGAVEVCAPKTSRCDKDRSLTSRTGRSGRSGSSFDLIAFVKVREGYVEVGWVGWVGRAGGRAGVCLFVCLFVLYLVATYLGGGRFWEALFLYYVDSGF